MHTVQPRDLSQERRGSPAGLSFAILVANLLIVAWFVPLHANAAEQFLEWRPFLAFQGEHPFQSRVLVFWIAKTIHEVHRLSDGALWRLFLAFDYLGMALCVGFLWKAARVFMDGPRAALVVFGLFWWQMAVTFVASQVHNYYYPYDLLNQGLVAVALWMIVSRQSLARLLPLTALAMLNRETAIVIPFLLLAFNWPAPRQVWRDVVVLLVVCVLIKAGIAMSLRAVDEMASLYHVPGYLRFFYNFSFLTLDPQLIHTANAFLMLGGTWLLLPFLPGKTERRLKNMLWCLLPYFAGMMVVGNLAEIRIFGEFIPLMSLALASRGVGTAAQR